jgi:hypothetical protein
VKSAELPISCGYERNITYNEKWLSEYSKQRNNEGETSHHTMTHRNKEDEAIYLLHENVSPKEE